MSTCRLLWFRFNGWWTIIPLTYYSHSTEYIASGICVHLQIINIAIQLNTLQMGYVSTCRLLYGSDLMGWWTIIPLTYYSHSTEYIASGICVHLQIINIAIQLNTLQVGYVSTCSLLNGHSAEYIASGICVHLQFINGHSAEYIASGICVHLQIINIAIQLNTLQVGYVSTCRLLT